MIKRGYNSIMKQAIDQHPSNAPKEWVLTIQDRCDRCTAQAFIKVVGAIGELLFCSHHYNKIIDNAIGYDAMMKFAYNVIDEREKLIDNKKTL
jgi:hypothetical protein